MDRLCNALQEDRAARHSILEPLDVVVPNPNMERHVEFRVAEAHGVAANLRFRRLERFVRDWLRARLPDTPLLDASTLPGLTLGCLLDGTLLGQDVMSPVRTWLMAAGEAPDAVARRRVQLSAQLSHLFLEYSLGRMELLVAWERGEHPLHTTPSADVERWQAALWRALRASAKVTDGPVPLTLFEAVRRAPRKPLKDDPPRCHLFGLSYMARAFQQVLAVLAQHMDVHLYVLNPCLEFWEDVASVPELRARLRKQRQELPSRKDKGQGHLALDGDDPMGMLADSDTPALRLWGRPGREHLRLLNALTDGNMDGPEPPLNPESPSLLHQLQHDIATRHPDRLSSPPRAVDGSIRVLACPSPQRELEVVAQRIWELLNRDVTTGPHRLRFQHMAVLINATQKDRYLPFVQTVFAAAQRLPHHVVDVPLWQQSRVVDAALRLLNLPHSSFTRSEVMEVALHPAVHPGDDGVDRSHWATLVDRLGIFHGVTHADHARTYVDRDVFNWDQGLRRVALGAVMAGVPSGETRLFAHADQHYAVEESREDTAAARRFGLVLRSLLADARALRSYRGSASAWADVLARYLGTYLLAPEDDEERDVRRVLTTLRELPSMAPANTPLDARTVTEMLQQELSALGGSRGEYLADGVVVSTLMPMRALPFRHTFLVGMTESTFPAADRRDQMDLRTARRAPGDVSAAERDRYTFLETLMCTRETLHISHVARDEQTGDALGPASVVHELLTLLQRNHGVRAEQLVERHALRRSADGADSVFDEVRREAAAREHGDSIRTALQMGDLTEEISEVRLFTGAAFPELSRLLELPSLPPERETLEEDSVLQLRMVTLRRFLECPMQAWARVVLRMQDAEETATAQDDEPLEAGTLAATQLLRAAFEEAGGSASVAMEVYRRQRARLQAEGQWPVGLPGRVWEEDHQQLFRRWERALSAQVGPLPVGLERVRLGAGQEHQKVAAVHPPLRFTLPDPRPARAGKTLTVELSGTTEALLPAMQGCLLMSHAALDKPEQRLMLQLRGFVDHVVLAAAGLRPQDPFTVVTLGNHPSEVDRTLVLGPVSQDVAMEWVSGLVAALLGSSHTCFFPADAVFTVASKTEDNVVRMPDASSTRATLRAMQVGNDSGASRFGPLPSAVTRPVPELKALHTMLQKRWGLFFRLLPSAGGGGR